MLPRSALYDITYCALTHTELPRQLWDRSLFGGIKRAYLSDLIVVEAGASIVFALQRTIMQSNGIRVFCIFGVRAVFEVVRMIILFVTILMVDLYIVGFCSERRRWGADKHKCNENVDRLKMALAVFAHRNHIIPSLAAVGVAYFASLSSSRWVNPINRTDIPKRRGFIDIFVSGNWFPDFHLSLLDAVLFSFYYTTFLNMCDWKAAGERYKGGSMGQSLEINIQRFGIDPQLAAILQNTRRELGW